MGQPSAADQGQQQYQRSKVIPGSHANDYVSRIASLKAIKAFTVSWLILYCLPRRPLKVGLLPPPLTPVPAYSPC